MMICPLLSRNEAAWDRSARIVLGLVLLGLSIWGPQTAWGLLGFVPLATGLAGSCPLYALARVSTRAASGAASGQR
jgi:Inner membrane protein YgaP-like, transmembrane domain